MRAVVTGGAGFIGSHLVERLLAYGHAVTVLDNFTTGRRRNLLSVQHHPQLVIRRLDVTTVRPEDLAGVDWVFHLAARADIVASIERPLDYHRANVDGTVALLEAARQAGVGRFLYAASSSCYGIPRAYPTPETAPLQPQYPYALTKLLGEMAVLHWGQVYGLPVVSLRLFNVYGPRARSTGYGAVLGVFLAQKLANQPMTLVGDGRQTRDFTFVTDVVEAFVMAAGSEVAGAVFNVGTGQPVPVRRLAALLGGGDTVSLPRRPGEPDRTHADVSKIARALGWRPTVSIEDGIGIMLEHLDEWRQAPVWTPAGIERATREWFHYLGPR